MTYELERAFLDPLPLPLKAAMYAFKVDPLGFKDYILASEEYKFWVLNEHDYDDLSASGFLCWMAPLSCSVFVQDYLTSKETK